MLNQFWLQFASVEKTALLLDYDGTLAPFRTERDQAVPYPGVRERVSEIMQNTETRVIIISGRAIDDLLPLLDLNPMPEVWGSHGWEHLSENGRRLPVDLPQQFIMGLEKARIWLEEQELSDFSEIKPASLAVHWRGLSTEKISALRDTVISGWKPFVDSYQLKIHPFNGGLELRCPGKDKGTAIKAILDELEVGVPVAFLGDDLTDEDGFKMIRGRGLGVLVSSEQRNTLAEIQISPPLDMLRFFDEWLSHAPRKL